MLHTGNNIFFKLKMLEALYIKFKQSVNRINFETSGYVLKCLKMDGKIHIIKNRKKIISLNVIEISKNHLGDKKKPHFSDKI